MNDLISSQISRVLEKALDGVTKRHTAIASNIANAETPGYNTRHLTFENNLKEAIASENRAIRGEKERIIPGALRTSDDRHINPKGFLDKGGSNKGMIERASFEISQTQGVDIESQMAHMTKNSLQYSALSRLEGRMFNTLRSVIKSSGGA